LKTAGSFTIGSGFAVGAGVRRTGGFFVVDAGGFCVGVAAGGFCV
jgi:hypothetical protein